ncbi:LCP family protein [Ohessyouella blattaphilus]|uniref:LCP family protein n=1 Tax=Ohessyouella blattaphilus TaxID=2949333 RepID=A0ABT1ED87_9FIRM|nr:LCP family protein [Ohessyouella blattaphilus]MCP1108660.1 LCP family protein [Ohessyouella blattaphilus]MCR8562054.1 LCP family protein [Ohessyouella blattaphilus]
MAKTQRRYRRGRRKRRWSIQKKLLVFFVVIIATLLTSGIIYASSKLTKLDINKLDPEKLSISDEVVHEKGYLNVALFGIDSRDGTLGEGNRSDTIMIASLNKETGDIKLVSIYRDTLLEMSDGSLNKANAAYAFGGPEEAVSMINKNLDMNIEKYVSVNFNALVDVVDALGGIEIGMTEAEAMHMNNYAVETAQVTGREYTRVEPAYNTYNLNGVQAVSYARIRYEGNGDFQRSERQRLVIEKILEKAKNANLSALNKIIDEVFPQVSTNFTLTEMLDYGKKVGDYNINETSGFPADNTTDLLNEVGSVVIPNTLVSNVAAVHSFLFPETEYLSSTTLSAIEVKISAKAGDRASNSSTFGDDDVDIDDFGNNAGVYEAPQTNYPETPQTNYPENSQDNPTDTGGDSPVEETPIPGDGTS